jgi:hypothetical protein
VAAWLLVEATEAAPPLVAVTASAEQRLQVGEVSNLMAVRYRHRHHRRRNPTERGRRQV